MKCVCKKWLMMCKQPETFLTSTAFESSTPQFLKTHLIVTLWCPMLKYSCVFSPVTGMRLSNVSTGPRCWEPPFELLVGPWIYTETSRDCWFRFVHSWVPLTVDITMFLTWEFPIPPPRYHPWLPVPVSRPTKPWQMSRGNISDRHRFSMLPC